MHLIEAYIQFAEKIHIITGKSEPFIVAVPFNHYCRLLDEAMTDRRTKDSFQYLMSEFKIQTQSSLIVVQPLNVPEPYRRFGV